MARDKAQSDIPPEKLELYDRLIRTRPDIERKGVALPYTPVNGHMFTFLSPSGSLAIRLPADESQLFIQKHKTSLAEAHGAALKEYASEVP